MATGADGLTFVTSQAGRLHNGEIFSRLGLILFHLVGLCLSGRLLSRDVQCPRSMTAFTSDRPLLNSQPVPIAIHECHIAGVTNQAPLIGNPFKASMLRLIIAGRHAPTALGPIPSQ